MARFRELNKMLYYALVLLLEGTRVSTGLCVDVSSGEMI